MKNPAETTDDISKQQCKLKNLYVGVLIFAFLYAGGVAFYGYKRNWPALFCWLVLLPCARWAGLRLSPFTSKWRGKGTLVDELPASVNKANVKVAFYSHNGCPFCPIVKRRLEALQRKMNFALTNVDLSFKPQLAASKGIRSVPVVEVGEGRLVGNVTTDQLARLISGAKS